MWWLEYLWNHISVWWFVAALVIVLGVFWQYIAPLWFILPKWMRWAIAAAIAIILAVQYGRNRGVVGERQRRADLNARAIQTRDNIDAKVKAMPPNAVLRSLERNGWLRDD